MAMLIILFLLPVWQFNSVLATASDDLCDNIKGCRCSIDSVVVGGITVTCKNTTSKAISNLPMENVTHLDIADSKLGDPSSIKEVRRSTIEGEKYLSIRKTKIKVFDWGWIPDLEMQQLTLSFTDTEDMYSEKFTGDNGTEFVCGFDHIQSMHAVYLMNQKKMKTIPSCLPNAIVVLNLLQTSLVNLGDDTDENGRTTIKWPTSLRILQLKNNSISKFSMRVFVESPPSLETVRIVAQNLKDGDVFKKLPAQSLTSLRVQDCKIEKILSEDFANFRRYNLLEALGLQFNKLVKIPPGLPTSIRILYLHNNRITTINAEALGNLNNLQHLELQRNLIKIVPPGLPRSIKILQLQHNKITTCQNTAFIHLIKLEDLNLGYNNLSSMPVNIPMSIRSYNLKDNRIYFIGARSNYFFCSRCIQFELTGNPWVCDSHMVNFLLWANSNGITSTTVASLNAIGENIRCKNSPFRGLDNWKLEYLIDYMKRIQCIGCSYNVIKLNCTGNALTEFPKLVLGLHEIYISDNPGIRHIPDSKFATQNDLYRLELNRNGFKRIPHGLPQSIGILSLVGNNITHISQKDAVALRNLTKIREIYLDHNRLKTFYLAQILPLSTLNLISLQGNPLFCDCTLWPLIEWLKDRQPRQIIYSPRSSGTCAGPPSVYGKTIESLQSYYRYKVNCLSNLCFWNRKDRLVNCSYATQTHLSINNILNETMELGSLPSIKTSYFWETIDASGMQLQKNGIKMKNLKGLRNVKLSNNSLNGFPIHGLPRSIKNLTLSNNNISSIPSPETISKNLPSLQFIDLRNNSIEKMDETEIRVLPNMKKGVLLHGNPLVCDCQLRPLVGWISANKDNAEVMRNHRLLELECKEPEALRGKLIANLTEPQYCPEVDVRGITGGLVGVITIFTILAILVNVYLHKRRKKREKEDILEGFRELLQREAGFDDVDPDTGVLSTDRFVYDAFVSYSPDEEDSDFAMLVLEELETKHNYKICVHERDFVPGIGIADNIVECIGASKRIILILSRNFVSSPWCQYEVQVALAELHQRRRSKLLIPVLLDDIEEDENIAGSVKTFLCLIQGIQIPKNSKEANWKEFWNKLIDAMPCEPLCEKLLEN